MRSFGAKDFNELKLIRCVYSRQYNRQKKRICKFEDES
jgi:hypothetical protein